MNRAKESVFLHESLNSQYRRTAIVLCRANYEVHSACLQGAANEFHLLQDLVRVTSDRLLRTGLRDRFKMKKLNTSGSLVTAEEKDHASERNHK